MTKAELIYDGKAELKKAKGFNTDEELRAWQKECEENDPAFMKAQKADACIVACWCKGSTDWHTLRLNKPITFFPELKKGKSCVISENGCINVTDRIMKQLFSNKKYNIVTDF